MLTQIIFALMLVSSAGAGVLGWEADKHRTNKPQLLEYSGGAVLLGILALVVAVLLIRHKFDI